MLADALHEQARRCQNDSMDDTRRNPADDPGTGAPMHRRAFFGQALVVAGAAAALMGLTGCPAGDEDDGDDDEDD
jgi:hypothetical protein